MRSTRNPDTFFRKMRKKPELQSLLANLPNLTNQEIDQLKQPAWIRTQLKKLKVRNETIPGMVDSNDLAAFFADNMIRNAKKDQTLEDFFTTEYDVVEWVGDVWRMPYSFSQIGQGGTIDIEYRDLFLIIKKGLIQQSHRLVKLSEKDFDHFSKNVTPFKNKKATINSYRILNADHISEKHGLKREEVEEFQKPKHPYEHLIDKSQRRFTSSDFR